MNWNWGIVLASAAALGSGSLAVWGLLSVRDLVNRFLRFRITPIESLRQLETAADEFTPDDLYDLKGVHWELWRVAGALAGLALAYLLFGERNPVLAAIGLSGVFAPRLAQSYLVRRRRAGVDRQVRDFIFLLRPALSVQGGLRPALEDVRERLEPGVVEERLKHHLERSFATSPVDAIEALGQDLSSPEMDRLVLGVRAARQGGVSYAEAVALAAEEAQERIREEARVAIEETPVRLLVPMLILLLPPILVLALYPLVARLMTLLAMPGSGGVGW